MSKLKAPLFSLEAHGTLKDSPTYTSSREISRAIATPTHLPTYTTPQLQQRFLYKLGVALWNAMTPAQRAPYQASALTRKTTAMNNWLQYWLLNLPNLTLCLPLAEGQGATAYDLSPNTTPLSLIGPFWQHYNHRHFLQTDGVDDFGRLPTANDLLLDTPAWTIVYLFRPLSLTTFTYIWAKATSNTHGWRGYLQSPGRLVLSTMQDGVLVWSATGTGYNPLNQLVVSGITMTYPTVTFYKNGQFHQTGAGVHPIPSPSAYRAHFFTQTPPAGDRARVELYWFIAFNRALTPAEHAAIARMFHPTTLPL